MLKPKKNFFYEGNYKKQIKAAGLFFTRIDEDNNVNILVQDVDCYKNGKRTQKLTDLGGRVDNTDTSPITTIARELYEESNGAFYYSTESGEKKYLNVNDLKEVIRNDKYNQIYSLISKYFLCFVNLPSTINIDFEKSGAYETHDVIKRELKWININEN